MPVLPGVVAQDDGNIDVRILVALAARTGPEQAHVANLDARQRPEPSQELAKSCLLGARQPGHARSLAFHRVEYRPEPRRPVVAKPSVSVEV
jgi:hypothetical protein